MRAGGILMPVFSLPSPYGIGCFSKEAYQFVDALVCAGQSYWQILPLGPTGYGDSPYQSFSAFAGNPYFIDLDTLCEEGLLRPEEYRQIDFGKDPKSVDYTRLYENRFKVLHRAFVAFCEAGLEQDAAFSSFCRQQEDWLEDYSLYMSIKNYYDGKSWMEWEDGIRLRDPVCMKRFKTLCRDEIRFQKFMQYQFMKQWARLRTYANKKGLQIIGDIPIYAALDGADAWSHPELFQFNPDRHPVRVAGCPPDAFAADGQVWGNPLYAWEKHEETDFAWWVSRMRRCMDLYDVIRVDHFRGFDEYFAIPYGEKTAAGGDWNKGPGMKLFTALGRKLGHVRIIAEDLGYVTESVMKLVSDSGYPGMKVVEFAFDSREAGDYMPYGYDRNCVVYTGTHDNQTLLAWYDELTYQDRKLLDTYLGKDEKSSKEVVWDLIRLTLGTVADTAIIPLADYLVLGSSARINRPSTLGSNWRWRLEAGQFTKELQEKIRGLMDVFGRIPNHA